MSDPTKERCAYVEERGRCDQAAADTVHTGWTDAQSGIVFAPLHDFTTEVVTTDKYTTLRTRTEKMEQALRQLQEQLRDFATCEEEVPTDCSEVDTHGIFARLAAIAREALADTKGE